MDSVCEYLTDGQYHGNTTHVSTSMLKVLRHSASEYWARYIGETMPRGIVATKQMDIGSIAHAAVLQGKPFRSMVAIYPDHCLKSNGALNPKPAAEWAEMQRQAGVPYSLKQADAKRCRDIIEAIRSSGMIVDFLEDERALMEHAIFWEHEETGLALRCKPDFLLPLYNVVLAFDFKITPFCHPRAFRRQVKGQSYWLQDAVYSDGIAAHFRKPVEFRFVCVNPNPPHQIFVNEIGAESRQRSFVIYEHLLGELDERENTGNWEDTDSDRVNLIAMSDWDFR